MADALDITQLMDWLEDRLTEDEAKAIAAILQADDSYSATVTWLQDFLQFSRATVLIEPPAEILQETTSHFRAFAQVQRPSSWLQRLVATLTSDSWQRPSLAGVRRAGLDVTPRQLVYQTDAADVILNIRPVSDDALFDLAGQVFPKVEADPAPFTVQHTLHGQQLEAALTYTDNMGKFRIRNLRAGMYTIIIRNDQVEITIADVDFSG